MRKLKLKRRRGLGNTAENYAYLYYGMFALCTIVYIAIGMISHGDSIAYSLFYRSSGNPDTMNVTELKYTTDTFMDFFNSVRDAADNGGYDNGVIYPPLASLLFLGYSKLFNTSLVGSEFGNRFNLRNLDPIALLVFFVSMMLCVFAVYLVIDRYLLRCGFKAAPAALAITSALSFPMWYAIQRGNVVIFAIPLTMFFVFFRNHERKLVRELSYIALALAAGLKIYPAVFGILLITDKKYKEAARLIIYGILAFVLPIFVFGGPDQLVQLVKNIFSFHSGLSKKEAPFRSGYSYQELVAVFIHNKSIAVFGKIVFWCMEAMALIMVFLLPKDWQKLTALCYMVFNIRSLSSIYALTFFLIPFVLFLTDKRRFKWNDYLYLLCLALMFIPLPCIWYGFTDSMVGTRFSGGEQIADRFGMIAHYAGVNKLVSVVAFQGIFLLLILDVLLTPSGDKKQGKGKKKAVFAVAEEAVVQESADETIESTASDSENLSDLTESSI